jgi:flavin reductase (DIM6/NTAB) family NADH-FMN oxidoreductase RutF
MSPQKTLRNAFGNFGTGVAIIGVHDDNGRAVGLTVNSFASVSLEPPLLSWCLDNNSQLYEVITAAKRFTVNILAADQRALSDRMAQPGDHGFAETEWFASAAGAPFVSGALAQFDCHIHQIVKAGDHAVFIGGIDEVLACEEQRSALVYFRGAYASLDADRPAL